MPPQATSKLFHVEAPPTALSLPSPEAALAAGRLSGKPPRKAKDVRRLLVERRREHSRKPDEIRERIERLVQGPYLELFAREDESRLGLLGRPGLAVRSRSHNDATATIALVDAPALLP
jgi:hypothetical protein